MDRRVRLAGILVLLATSVLSAGQTPQTPAAQTPTFRSGVEYVEVDAIVTDPQGRFIRDLKKEDFQVLEDGKRQIVSDFTLIDIPIERYDKPLYATQPIDPDVKSNEHPFEGRVYVMVIDDLHTDFTRTVRTKAAARQFIQQRMGANDIMAVLHTAGGDDASQEFTNSKRLLLAAVEKTVGHKLQSATLNRIEQYNRTFNDSASDPEDMERATNAESSLRLLKDVADWFATVRGRRKAILFVSEGIDYDITQVVSGGGFDPSNGVTPPAAWSSSVMDATREAVNAAMRSNVSIFGIDPRGLTNMGADDITVQEYPEDPSVGVSSASLRNELQLAQDSLRTLSDETGGFAVVGRNDLSAGFDRIVADNSSYYVLAYYPPTDKRDGKFHKIDVRVTKPGLTVRSRRGYLSPKGKAPAKPALPADGPSLELRDALNSPLPVNGLTMNVTVAAFKGTAPNASVLVTTELRGRDLTLGPNDTLELSYLAVDAHGKVRGGSNDRMNMNLKPDTKARVQQSGFRMLNRLDLPPGRYQVRIASRDQAGGLVGSVAYDLEVPDFYKLPFSMSGLVMTSLSNASMVTAKPDGQLKDVLPAPPVAQRTFPQNDEIALFAEVYDNSGKSPHKVDIRTTITADDGKVMFKAEEERASSEIGGDRGGYGYMARVPLSDIPPGSYVLTVEAKSRLANSPAVTRQVQIKVTPPSAPPDPVKPQ